MKKRFKAFISFDIEGVSAITSRSEYRKESDNWNMIRQIATGEVNAAVRGIRKTKPNAVIVVCDSHAEGLNLLVDKLEPGIELVKGTPRTYYMIEGIDRSFDMLFLIGYHAMAGTKKGLMDHTYSSSLIYRIKINGIEIGETEINAAVAGFYGVPLGLVTGDDQLSKEVRKFFGRSVENVITKYGVSRSAARIRLPADVFTEIETKAGRACAKINQLKPFNFKKPLTADFEVLNTLIADVCEPIPGMIRISGRHLRFKPKDILEFYRVMGLICDLGASTLR